MSGIPAVVLQNIGTLLITTHAHNADNAAVQCKGRSLILFVENVSLAAAVQKHGADQLLGGFRVKDVPHPYASLYLLSQTLRQDNRLRAADLLATINNSPNKFIGAFNHADIVVTIGGKEYKSAVISVSR